MNVNPQQYRRWDLNPHAFLRHRILSPMCLPIPPLRLYYLKELKNILLKSSYFGISSTSISGSSINISCIKIISSEVIGVNSSSLSKYNSYFRSNILLLIPCYPKPVPDCFPEQHWISFFRFWYITWGIHKTSYIF